ncbi:glycosyltransferase [Streptomyces sp. ALB3]|uniref:glycosyltransferase n=1 Tax=Streptomyces sp. ALB3 TaxID=3374278 RepID=UPI00378D3C58
MRIGLLTDGGYPYANGESRLWCDRLVRGLPQHRFDLFALSRSADQEQQGRVRLPDQVGRVRTAPLWTHEEDVRHAGRPRGLPGRLATGLGRSYGRRDRRRFTAHVAALVGAVCAGTGTRPAGDRTDSGAATGLFTDGLYGLAELAREHGGLRYALRSEATVRIVEAACRAPGTGRTVHGAAVPDHLAFVAGLERALRPLSLDWYDEDGLGAVDLCHAASGGAAALPGLLAKRFFGLPLLVTEYGVPLRAHYLAAPEAPLRAPVRALLANFHGLLASEVYRQAALITPGNTHVRRWQERFGAGRSKLRTVYPGMEAARFAAVGEGDDKGGPRTLVWIGRIEPAKDLTLLLHAFAEVRRAEPDARLRIFGAPVRGGDGDTYLAHCRALAARLFPDEAAGPHAVGAGPVTFEEIGGPEVPDLAEAYAAGGVVVLSSTVEGFPISLVEAMFCGRATVSTDVGAVVEVVGGTGLVVPPRNPRALADACVALLRDPERRARLGAAARARALELFTVEQNLAAFRGIYLDLVGHAPVRRTTRAEPPDPAGAPRPFATPPEDHVLSALPPEPVAAASTARSSARVCAGSSRVPSWAIGSEGVHAGVHGAGDGDA